MLKSILLTVLMIYIITGSFLKVPKMIKKYSNLVITILFICACLSLYLNEPLVSILIISSIIVYLYSIDISVKKKDSFQVNNQILKIRKSLINKDVSSKDVSSKDVSFKDVSSKDVSTTSTKVIENKQKEKILNYQLKTQTDIFNKLNYDLFYNELGDQFNIQGFDEIKGFDQTIYN